MQSTSSNLVGSEPVEGGRQLTRPNPIRAVVESKHLGASPRPSMEIHVVGKESKMGPQPKSGVVDVELADSVHGTHCGVHACDQIGERANARKVGVSQSCCCRLERGQWNSPLMGPALPIRPPSEPGFGNGPGEVWEVPEIPKLADCLGTVATNVVPDDSRERAKPLPAAKAAAAWVRPSVGR
jgi:hypothetical protein